MELFINCDCGKRLPVEPRQAGSAVTCHCGRVCAVPGLGALRISAGLAAYEADPVALIRNQLVEGSLPQDGDCKRCGAARAPALHLSVVCERAFRRSAGQAVSPEWHLIALLFGIWGLLAMLAFRGREQEVEELGRDTAVRVPLPLCADCRGWPVSGVYLTLIWSVRWLLFVASAVVVIFWTYWGFTLFALGLGLLGLEVWVGRIRQQSLRELLRNVPLYGQLLEKHPDAEVFL